MSRLPELTIPVTEPPEVCANRLRRHVNNSWLRPRKLDPSRLFGGRVTATGFRLVAQTTDMYMGATSGYQYRAVGRFEPAADGGTVVHVQIRMNPAIRIVEVWWLAMTVAAATFVFPSMGSVAVAIIFPLFMLGMGFLIRAIGLVQAAPQPAVLQRRIRDVFSEVQRDAIP